jgi:hypothetical protein
MCESWFIGVEEGRLAAGAQASWPMTNESARAVWRFTMG